MADEITLSIDFKYSKNGADSSFSSRGLLITVSGNPVSEAVQSIGTSYEALAMGEVVAPGYVTLKNLDITNYVEFSADSGGANPLIKLKALEVACFRMDGTTIYARANTGACLVQYKIISN